MIEGPHTPGPWRSIFTGWGGSAIVEAAGGEDAPVIATVTRLGLLHAAVDPGRGNTWLIREAPTLLAAASSVLAGDPGSREALAASVGRASRGEEVFIASGLARPQIVSRSRRKRRRS